jgi:hypothetical protein
MAASAWAASGELNEGGNESSAIVTPLLVEPVNLQSSSAQGVSLSRFVRMPAGWTVRFGREERNKDSRREGGGLRGSKIVQSARS